MKLTYKQWIQVLLSLLVALWIFWFLYKDIRISALTDALRETSLSWLGLSIVIALYGYWLRAWRWKLLIEAGENVKTPTFRAFWALMVGYLVNLLVPRAGEVARCGVLKKTEDKQLGKLFGTVILERSLDLVFLVGTVILAFLLERTLFLDLLGDLVAFESLWGKLVNVLPILLGGTIVALIFMAYIFQRYRESSLIKKTRHFLRDLVKGLISLRQVNNQSGFWMSSIALWLSYYLMMYCVAQAIPSTASLSPSSVLMVMVMGSIGMIAPVQGGIGTFHALVAFILMAYGLTEEQGKIFAVIIHGSQVLTVILIGLIALGAILKITARKEPKVY